MAIDETVEFQLCNTTARIDARFDRIEAKVDSRKLEIAALVITSSAALIGVCLAAYEHGFKRLLGSW